MNAAQQVPMGGGWRAGRVAEPSGRQIIAGWTCLWMAYGCSMSHKGRGHRGEGHGILQAGNVQG